MQGSLVCLGLGMTLGAHISPICRSYIEQADIVFSGVSHPLMELWLQEMHPNVHSLQQFYGDDKSRNVTYQQMVEALLTPLKQGKKVVGAFYGHPGVFAKAPHQAIEQAKALGYQAKMLPGISAESCLYADLGIDPGRVGCQHFEASQFMFYQRQIDPSAYLVLWQIGIAGDTSMTKFSTTPAHLQVLVELLSAHYPLDTPVVIYEAAVIPIDEVRAEAIELQALPNAKLHQYSTLVIPPVKGLQKNQAVLDKLAAIIHHQAVSNY